MKNLMKALNEKPIAYYKIYRRITGSTTAGILLSQLMYWLSKKDEIHKTDADIMKETLLTPDELKSAKRKIKALDFIKVQRRGIPAKTYYEIDWDKYMETLSNFADSSLGESHKLDGGNPTNSGVDIPPTINDQTFETTTEKKKKKEKKPAGAASSSSSSTKADTAVTFAEDGEFNAVYAELRMSGDNARKYLGSKQNAFNAYRSVKGFIDIRQIARAYRQYLSSVADDERIVGLATFIDNAMYIGYLPRQMTVRLDDGSTVSGYRDGETLHTDTGATMQFTDARFIQKLMAGQIGFGV